MNYDEDSFVPKDLYRPFYCFDPVQTYSKKGGSLFVLPNGQCGKTLTQDTWALFLTGQSAFERLTDGDVVLKEKFNEGYKSFFESISELHAVIIRMGLDGKLRLEDKTTSSSVDVLSLSLPQIIYTYWDMHSKHAIKSPLDKDMRELFRELFLFHALWEVDNALIALDLGAEGAVIASIEAANALSNAIAIESGNIGEQKIRSEIGLRAAIARHAQDPKQIAKSKIKEHWMHWQEDKSTYQGKAAFARDMLDAYEALVSSKVIENWCREWESGRSKK